MAVFVGGLYLAIDCTAGERERQSLESLLVNPVSRGAIVGGKWLAVSAAALAAALVSLTGFAVALEAVPLQNLGVRFHFTAATVAGLLAACVPMALFASALQMTMAFFARSFKEATTYLSF